MEKHFINELCATRREREKSDTKASRCTDSESQDGLKLHIYQLSHGEITSLLHIAFRVQRQSFLSTRLAWITSDSLDTQTRQIPGSTMVFSRLWMQWINLTIFFVTSLNVELPVIFWLPDTHRIRIGSLGRVHRMNYRNCNMNFNTSGKQTSRSDYVDVIKFENLKFTYAWDSTTRLELRWIWLLR